MREAEPSPNRLIELLLMLDIERVKQSLKAELPQKGLSYIIKSLKELLPADSPKYNAVILLENEFKQLKVNALEGVLSFEEQNRQQNHLAQRIITLLSDLEADDFVSGGRSRLANEQKIKKGHVLYRIPKEMQLAQETRCLVRIAFDKETLVRDLDLDPHTALRSVERVSDYMKVELCDPAASAVFVIRSSSELVQFIDADDYTEWRFWVKPLKPGHHLLELKVAVMMQIDGEIHVRERVLEESVVIVAEKPTAEATEAPFRRMAGDLVMPCTLEVLSGSERSGFGLRSVALAFALLVGLSSAAYAFGPAALREQVDWLSARYLQNTAAAYEAFLETYPDSHRREAATFLRAAAKDSPEALQGYLETYPQGGYQAEAQAELVRLETVVWQEVISQTSPYTIDRYLRLYPQGPHQRKALELLLDPKVWAVSQPAELPEEVAADTAGAHQRLRDLQSSGGSSSSPFGSGTKWTATTKLRTATRNANASTGISDKKRAKPLVAQMVRIEGGTFEMGCTDEQQPDCSDDEKAVHTITVASFYLGQYEVTFAEYESFCEATGRSKPNDEGWGRGYQPVINVSWYDAIAYCNWLSLQQDYTPVYHIQGDNVTPNWSANGYRLPTEAEWEYAARGGIRNTRSKYSGSNDINEVAWYNGNSIDRSHPVGRKKPNELGLYDMSGNIGEWCWDWYNRDYYSRSSKVDPRGPEQGSYRVDRGGGWNFAPRLCRSTDRNSWAPQIRNPIIGFRLARS